ncbi:hypothetical protein EQP59_07290 [Ornithobacterium rhinotracheale]|uniref:Uncharacterized protein n=1 Tax=Ornithobacterium rhinotracheale TaxID=28251 RepID=A0A3R5UY32_ORNRH|nr:hypothetical protein [Ornithobacterium rhinotracheale]QAR31149.1 hypothetical protein EQP59_07290 [Ornithobacterium rhinotracheale]
MTVSFIKQKLEDILITGYTELGEIAYFSPMMWWVYLKTENNYILLTSNDGTISIEEKSSIECNFDIEDGDLFTISSFSKLAYGTISKVDFFYFDDTRIGAIGIGLSNDYILLDAISLNGFDIRQALDRDVVIENRKSMRIVSIE